MRDTSPENVRSIMDVLGIERTKVKPTMVEACCPFHQEKRPSFAVLCGRAGMPRYNCFGCGVSGSLMHLFWLFRNRLSDEMQSKIQVEIALKPGEPWGDKPKKSASGLEYVPYAATARQTTYRPMPERAAPKNVSTPSYRPAPSQVKEEDLDRFSVTPPEYLTKDRGLDPSVLMEYDVRDDTRKKRAVFTIRDWSGILQGWSSRSYWKLPICLKCNATIEEGAKECQKCGMNLAKYIHTTGLDRNNLLYGEHQFEPGTMPLIVEGFIDVLIPVQFGVKAVASPLAVMGSHPSVSQICRMLKPLPSITAVAVMGDNDEAGRGLNRDVDRFLSQEEPHRRLITMLLPDGIHDPGELRVSDVRSIIDVLEMFQSSSDHRSTIQL